MAKSVAAILYSLTALATLMVSLESFGSIHATIAPVNFRWLPSFAVIDFAVPAVFFLASISAVWASDKLRVARWVTVAAVLVLLMLVFGHDALGWKLFLEAAGELVSAVFVIGALAGQASTIAGIGVALYAVVQSQYSILSLQ